MFYSIPSKRRADWLLIGPIGLIALICFFSASAQAQLQQPPAPPPSSQPAPQPFTQEELKQLLGPIALYPDALIALILPASTVPSDLVLAARFVASKGDPAQVANQPWDDSVKSLARYPDIVTWMDQNLEWTTQLGEAFLDQPADVMNTIQQLRAQARAAGTLIDTPQQKVVEDQSYIRIVPAEPEVIYVPQYDPEVVYVESYEPYPYGGYESYSYTPYWGSALTFGIGFAVGPWLNYDCDWPRRRVCVGDWNPRWRNNWDSEWRRGSKPGRGDYEVRNTVNVVNINSASARVWEPSQRAQRQQWQRQRNYKDGSRENFAGREREGRDSWRRFSSVQTPSRLRLEGPDDNSNREDGRRSARDRSDSERGRSEEFVRRGSRVQDATPGPQFDRGPQNSIRERRGRDEDGDPGREPGRRGSRVQEATPGPQFNQGQQNSSREGRARVRREDPDRNSSESVRRGSRVQETTPGPQFDQGEEQNRSRQRANRRDDAGEARRSAQPRSQSLSRQQSRASNNVEQRRYRADDNSARVNRSSPSPNRNNSRPQQFKHSASRAESASGERTTRNRNSSAQERRSQVKSQGGKPSHQAARSRSSQGNTSNYNRPKNSQQSARVERSSGQSRRVAPSASRQGQQPANAGSKSRGGGKQGGKKADRDKKGD
jgi:hypothetical protein